MCPSAGRAHVQLHTPRYIPLAVCAVALFAGCVSISSVQREQIDKIKSNGGLNGFEKPKKPFVASALNILPGIGNIYLASGNEGRSEQYLNAVANFFLWPISVLWAVPEGYVDAGRINDLKLLEMSGVVNTNSEADETISPPPPSAPQPEQCDSGHVYPQSPLPLPSTPQPKATQWKVDSWKAFESHVTFTIQLVDENADVFEVDQAVKERITQKVSDDFLRKNSTVERDSVRVYFSDYELKNSRLSYVATVLAAQPVKDGCSYDDITKKGVMKIRVTGNMQQAREMARSNIEDLVKSKNIAIETGAKLPPNAKYRTLGERVTDDGLLEVEFETID